MTPTEAATQPTFVLHRSGEAVELIHVLQHGDAMVALVELAGGRRKIVRLDELASFQGRARGNVSVFSPAASAAIH